MYHNPSSNAGPALQMDHLMKSHGFGKIGYTSVQIDSLNQHFAKHELTAGNLLGVRIRGNSVALAASRNAEVDSAMLLENNDLDNSHIYAIDALGRYHYLVTADLHIDHELKFGELVTKLGQAVLGRRVPNVICATSTNAKNTALFLVDARSGHVTRLNAVERGVHPSVGRVLNDNIVLAAAGKKFYGGLFDQSKKMFIWTLIGEAPDEVTFLSRVDGDYILGATKDGNQIVVKGIATMTSKNDREAEFLIVMRMIPDTARPIGRVAGDPMIFAQCVETDDGSIKVVFAPWTNSSNAPAIVRAMHEISAAS